MPRALISVYDKTGLVDFARKLVMLGWDMVASGGTEALLRQAGLPVTPVEQLTGVGQLLDGRVKTLHPAIHAGILSRPTEQDTADLRQYGYGPIAMVICNLYPFQQTIALPDTTLQDAIEQIDIGGVTLLRAAAKNFLHRLVITDPADYETVLLALASHTDDIALRRDLAVKAFAHTRDYDTAIHAYLAGDTAAPVSNDLPIQLSIGLHQIASLRYGENSHQNAAFYSRRAGGGPLGGTLMGGNKELSYNNILDLDAAWRTVSSFKDPTVVIVKHLNPCGVASGLTLAEAYPAALASDPVSAFGGVIGVNQMVDVGFVDALGALFVEAIAAPGFTDDAKALLQQTRANCRLLAIPGSYDGVDLEIRSVHRGILVQQADMGDPDGVHYRTVTHRTPTPNEIAALRYGWSVVQHVKSNAIVLAVDGATVGVGGGLSSRVDAVHLAVMKAGARSQGAVLASDAFFPFPDGIETAAAAGVTAVIQPGGSVRDQQVIEVANAAGMAMIFTGTRHFRH